MTRRLLLSLLCLSFLAAGAFGQANLAAGQATTQTATDDESLFALDSDIPLDPQLRRGVLENGLRYWVRVNGRPEKRAELRLVVNAGSILEDDDQRGLAHFIEHMAFNGSKNFEKQALVDYLESIGMRFGPDLNAYTSFDETVYMLQVPTDDSEIVAAAFQILEDWAHLVSFDDEEVDKERGVVIEEWRGGRGAGARVQDQQFPVLFKDSLYADRLAIGNKETLESFEYDTLRRYYRDWYRPDLMGVIAVGDFDPEAIEGLIRSHFAGLRDPSEKRERFVAPVPDHEETLVSIVSDPEISRTSVSIAFKGAVEPQGTVGDYRRTLVEGMFYGMLNQRLAERAQEAEPPFLGAGVSGGSLVRSKSVHMLGAGVVEGGLDTGLGALLTEAERARRHGFRASELERQKTNLLRFYETAVAERDKTNSGVYASEYVRAFLEGEPTPGIVYENELAKRVVPGISLQEVDAVAQRFFDLGNRVILVSSPERDSGPVTDRETLLAAFRAAAEAEIGRYEDRVAEGPLLAELPAAGRIVERLSIAELDLEQWLLSNGIRVILRPTDFKNDEVRFTSFSPGGHSLVDDEDYVAALTAASILGQSGVGHLDLIELGKALTGKVVGVTSSIGELSEGVSGRSSPDDLETLFQLIHLYLTAPRKDQEAFESYRTRMRGAVENRDARPETLYQDRLQAILSQDHFRRRPFTEELLEELDLERSYAIYRDRFKDIGDFTFFFVGNFELEKMEGLVSTYLASLPSTGREETFRDVGVDPPRGVIEETLYRGLEEKARVQIIFTGPFEWTRQNRYDISSMTEALQILLRETLREDMGGTYGVRVGASTRRFPDTGYRLSIGFGCAPEAVADLTAAVFEKIAELKKSGGGEEVVANLSETQRRQRETQLRQNGFWLNTLRFYYYHGEDPRQLLDLDTMVATLSRETIREAAKRYLDEENYVKVVLMPESARPESAAAETEVGAGV